MADLAVGLVSLSLQVCKGLMWYVDGAKSAEDRSTQILNQIDTLAGLLERLDLVVKRREVSGTQEASSAGIVACAEALRKIEKKLGSGKNVGGSKFQQQMRSLGQRLAFPFKQDDIMFLKNMLASMQQQLEIALHALQLEALDDTRYQICQAAQLSQQNHQALLERMGNNYESSSRQSTLQTQLIQSASHASYQRMGTIQAELAAVSTYLDPMAADLSTVSVAFPQMLSKLSRLEEKLDSMTPASLSPRAIEHNVSSFDGIASDMKKMSRTTSKKRYVREHCTCHGQSNTTELLQWPVSIIKTISSVHLPHCPYAAIQEAVTNLQVRFTMCSISLRRKAYIGLALSHGAGTVSISPVLECHRIVLPSSPAFRLLDGFFWGVGRAQRLDAWEKPATELLRLFQLRKASPHDRLPNGMTLLHYFCNWDVTHYWVGNAVAQIQAMGKRMLEYLPMQAMEKDDEEKTCLDYCIVNSYPVLVEHFIDHGIPAAMWKHVGHITRRGENYGLHFSASAEDLLDCSEQMKAVVLQSKARLLRVIQLGKTTLESREGSVSLYELATCVGWKRGCEILLEKGVEIPKGNPFSRTLLRRALLTSHIDLAQFWLQTRRGSSMKELEKVGDLEDTWIVTRKTEWIDLFISALVEQRQELQVIAAEHGIDVRGDRLLDARAHAVVMELEDRGIEVHPSLKPTRRSMYHNLSLCRNAHVLDPIYRAGFHDVTAEDFDQDAKDFFISPLFYLLASSNGFRTPNEIFKIVPWFLSHGANLAEKWPGSDTTLAHCLGYRLGLYGLPTSFSRTEKDFSSYFASQIADGCKCACSTAGCLFVTSLCKRLTVPNYIHANLPSEVVERLSRGIGRFWRNRLQIMAAYVREAVSYQKNRWLVTEFIRLSVFTDLGIRHTCCNIWPIMNLVEPDISCKPSQRYDDEELQIVQEEDASLVVLLEELVEKFDQLFDKGIEDVETFFKSTVVGEMDRVLAQLREEDKAFAVGRREMGVFMRDAEMGGGGGEVEEITKM